MIELEINQQKITVQEGTSIIEAADQVGIYIPRFCYHKKLSIVANCRMCLVEVDCAAKPLPACATLVTAGMKVYTASPKALAAQRAVMEFLLINHPLDCPICDQGGECQLQDQSMGYGRADSEYNQVKRAVFSEDLGPLIDTAMTRCIHCTRCVRFGEEVAGLPELGATFRGENMQIGTYVKHFMRSEISGNIIDLCPVGALTSKPFDYTARAWELKEHPSIAPHDCLGSHIFVHSRNMDNAPQRRVMRVVPRANEAVNEIWLSDRDRFSYEALHHSDRLLEPMVKRNGQWKRVGWQAALLEIVDRTRAIVNLQGAEQIAALASPNSTVEEFYLLQKLMRALGSSNIDHRLSQMDLSEQPELGLGLPIGDINHLTAVLLVGSKLRQEQPLIAARVFKAHKSGAKIMAVNAMDYEFNHDLSAKLIVPSSEIPKALVEIALALAELNKQTVALPKIHVTEAARSIAKNLKDSVRSALFIGAEAINHPHANLIRYLAQLITELSGAKLGSLSVGANSLGAWLTGAVPKHLGLNAKAMLTTDPVRAYYLLGVEPEFDSAYPAAALQTLKAASLVVCFSVFKTEAMLDYADFILPITPFTENSGTLINAMGEWQTFQAASLPHGESKPAWKVLRVLANLSELEGFDYQKTQEIIAEFKSSLVEEKTAAKISLREVHLPELTALTRLAPWPIYRTDPLVRRAKSLQQVQSILDEDLAKIVVNQKTADKLQLRAGEWVTAVQGDSKLSLPLAINHRLADDMVLIASGLNETAGFGCAYAPITLERGTL